MTKKVTLYCYRVLLGQAYYFVIGIILIIFMGIPFYFLADEQFSKYAEYANFQGLKTYYQTEPGAIINIYTDKTRKLNGVSPVVIEYQFIRNNEMIRTEMITIDSKNVALFNVGDNVVIRYNKTTSLIEGLKPHIEPIEKLSLIWWAGVGLLALPAIFGILIIYNRIRFLLNVVWLHKHGVRTEGEITDFKHIRENLYEVEYLYQPIESKFRIRHRCKAYNYEQIGEQAHGDKIAIVYEPSKITNSCVYEF